MYESFLKKAFIFFPRSWIMVLIVPVGILCIPKGLKLLIPTLMSVFSTKISGVGSIMPGWISPVQSTADGGPKRVLFLALIVLFIFAVKKFNGVLNMVY